MSAIKHMFETLNKLDKPISYLHLTSKTGLSLSQVRTACRELTEKGFPIVKVKMGSTVYISMKTKRSFDSIWREDNKLSTKVGLFISKAKHRVSDSDIADKFNVTELRSRSLVLNANRSRAVQIKSEYVNDVRYYSIGVSKNYSVMKGTYENPSLDFMLFNGDIRGALIEAKKIKDWSAKV